MVTEKWTLHCAVIGSAQINQTKEFDVDPRVVKMFEYGSGSVDPTFAAFDGDSPIIRFNSTAMKRVFAAIDVNNGQALSAGTPCDLYYQQMAPGGTRLAGSTGMKVRISAGIAVIARARGQDGQGPIQAEVEVTAVSTDGETSPLTVTTGVALPTLLATDQLYTIGPCLLAGAVVNSIESFEFDPKIQVKVNRGDGQAYGTFAYILRRGNEQEGPSVKVTTRTLSGASGGNVVAVGATDYLALRAYKSGANREALTALKHIKFTPNAGAIVIDRIAARDGDEGMLSLDVAAVRTATLPAFSITTDVALA